MAIDFTSYQPPGVFVEEGASPAVPTTGVTATVVALVGPSRGYRTFSEILVASTSTPVAVTKLGVDPATVVVATPLGLAYTLADDYTVVVGSGDDGDSSALLDNTTSISLPAGTTIANGASIRVTYQYTDEEFFSAIRVDEYESVKDYYGEAFDLTTGAILSPLSLAARIAFENGAREVILASTAGNASGVTRAQLSSAYAKLNGLYDVSIVVPLPVGITGTVALPGDTTGVGTDLATHVANASDGGFFRTGVLGLEKTVTVAPETIATGIASSRVMYAYPNKMTFFNSLTAQTIEIGGYYLAAAYAGRISRQATEMPLTKKIIAGFSGIPSDVINTMTAAAKNTWSNAGVAVTELTRQRNLVVRHGSTTDPSSLSTREVSVVRAKDALVRLIEDSVASAGLVGQPIRDNTVIEVKGIVQGGLESAVDAGLIVAYQNLGARLRPGDPQIIEVKFSYSPSYPLNYILINFSINSSTGDATLSTGATA